MKLLFLLAVFVLSSLACPVFAQPGGANIIPRPWSVTSGNGSFSFTRQTQIFAPDPASRRVADLFNARLLSSHGFKLQINGRSKGKGVIAFHNTSGVTTDVERYSLIVEDKGIHISGSERGLFAGAQSLMQLLPSEIKNEATIAAVDISDEPRFPYRGMHLDVARHFQGVDFVKRYIDLMSQYKFNYFHWHLTDDQGWRIEIKKYPKLTEIGSKRPESHLGPYTTTFRGDGTPHGGFYTQAQIKDVVKYAKARHITVIPEIELPGHASAALAAYPELGKGCAAPDYKFEVKKTWGIFKEVFCPTDETFKFLEDVLDETIKLFPDSPYIHIGGDEVLKDFWKESPIVQELKKKHNLKDEHEVQSYFVQRIEKHVNARGKKIIGWDEILEGGLAPNATVMSWRGMRGGIEAAKSKHDVIMTPTDFVYFDYGQGDPAYEPLNIGSYVPLSKVYSFEPVPPELTADEAKYVIGGQANVWTEYIETPQQVEYMAFPRMLALSEVLWSKKEDRNFTDFQRRLFAHLPHLDRQKVNYRIPEPTGLANAVIPKGGALSFEGIRSEIPGARVHFTVDGSEPNERSSLMPSRFVADPKDGEVLTLKTIVVLPTGRKSAVYAATFVRGEMREPHQFTGGKPGLTYDLAVPGGQPESLKGETRSTSLNQFAQRIDLKKPFGVQFDGYFKVPEDGIYEFQVESTWDTTVVFGIDMIINDTGSAEPKKRSAIVPLKAGLHKISLRYNHRGGDPHFRFRWGIKGRGLTQAWGGEFVH